MKKNLFTLIIPVKKINKYVDETVEHIKNQKYKNWELIIVENFPSVIPKNYKSKKIKFIYSGRVDLEKKEILHAKLLKEILLLF